MYGRQRQVPREKETPAKIPTSANRKKTWCAAFKVSFAKTDTVPCTFYLRRNRIITQIEGVKPAAASIVFVFSIYSLK
jgi:hypothetical protein